MRFRAGPVAVGVLLAAASTGLLVGCGGLAVAAVAAVLLRKARHQPATPGR
jgi:hypothetical protein